MKFDGSSALCTKATGAQRAPGPKQGRLAHLDAMRAAAALMVCLSHFGFTRGWYDAAIVPLADAGVFIFFVISGYLIPRVISAEGYRLRSFASYLAKRVARLHPPFVAALLITFVISAAAAKVKGAAPDWPAATLLAQAFFLNIPPENPVFWTLQVEMCFYIFLGLAFPLLNAQSGFVRAAAFVAPCLAFALGMEIPFLNYVAFFALGISLEQLQRGAVSRNEFAFKVAFAAAAIWACTDSFGMVVGILALAIIARPPRYSWPRPVLWFGGISYSFYLLHYPIGVKFLNLAVAKFPTVPTPLLGVVAFARSVLVAWALHGLVERRAMAMSRRIRATPDGGDGIAASARNA